MNPYLTFEEFRATRLEPASSPGERLAIAEDHLQGFLTDPRGKTIHLLLADAAGRHRPEYERLIEWFVDQVVRDLERDLPSLDRVEIEIFRESFWPFYQTLFAYARRPAFRGRGHGRVDPSAVVRFLCLKTLARLGLSPRLVKGCEGAGPPGSVQFFLALYHVVSLHVTPSELHMALEGAMEDDLLHQPVALYNLLGEIRDALARWKGAGSRGWVVLRPAKAKTLFVLGAVAEAHLTLYPGFQVPPQGSNNPFRVTLLAPTKAKARVWVKRLLSVLKVPRGCYGRESGEICLRGTVIRVTSLGGIQRVLNDGIRPSEAGSGNQGQKSGQALLQPFLSAHLRQQFVGVDLLVVDGLTEPEHHAVASATRGLLRQVVGSIPRIVLFRASPREPSLSEGKGREKEERRPRGPAIQRTLGLPGSGNFLRY